MQRVTHARFLPLLGLILLTLPAMPGAEDHGGEGEEAATWRMIPIPAREHGYHNFDNRTITTQAAWDAFVREARRSDGWNEIEAFVSAIEEAAVNFDEEALVLLRQTEGSGSTKVIFHEPRLQHRTLTCTITRRSPETGTADMAYYCFALAVRQSDVDRIVVEVADVQETKTVDLAASEQEAD